MTKSLYYRNVIQRVNPSNAFNSPTFRYLASYTRLLLEVFIRKDFGERYFSLSKAINLFVVLGAFPLALNFVLKFRMQSRPQMPDLQNMPHVPGMPDFQTAPEPAGDGFSFWVHWLTWYIFLALFLYQCIRHHKQMKRLPTVFNFERYSLSAGIIHPKFYEISAFGVKGNRRMIEVFLEPALFFLIGVVLWIIGQWLGILLVYASLWYRSSYIHAYAVGDHFVMDKIDEMICNEELKRNFVDDLPQKETRGFTTLGYKPADIEKRKQLFKMMTEEIQDVK